MATASKRLEEAHASLLQLYSHIPALTPSLEFIKANQVEFVALNGRLRQLQELVAAGHSRADKARKQLDSMFTINKVEHEKAYRQEINQLKALEDERRTCLRNRDNIVTAKLKLQKDKEKLLEETRQLKRLNELVFDRSHDEIANTDFPEELYWQLELKEYDLKINNVKQQLLKYNTALSNLARAANLSEAALMALIGYPEAAYKVWRVEYALTASRKMRLYLRVELSLSNAYSNENTAREACPGLIPSMAIPVKPSSAQAYFEPVTKNVKGKYKVVPFDAESTMREYISKLRAAHKSAELFVTQETERMNSLQKYREAIIPRLSKIRRHIFQNSCLGGYSIEGWEDENGASLLGTEADILTNLEVTVVSTTPQSTPSGSRRSHEATRDEEARNTSNSRERRGSTGSDQATEILNYNATSESRLSDTLNEQMNLSAGRAPLSTIVPGNMLGSEVLMEVDRQRQAEMAQRSRKSHSRVRSHSRTGRDHDHRPESGSSFYTQQAQGSSSAFAAGEPVSANSTGQSDDGQEEREGRRRSVARGFFAFARGRRSTSRGNEDANTSGEHFTGRRNRNTIDFSGLDQSETDRPSRHRNVPSISISNQDEVDAGGVNQHPLRRTLLEDGSMVQFPTSGLHSSASSPVVSSLSNSSTPSPPNSTTPLGPRVMSMDEYVGVGPVATRASDDTGHTGDLDPTMHGSAPLIPSYDEHQMHQALDPESVVVLSSTTDINNLPQFAEDDEVETGRIQELEDRRVFVQNNQVVSNPQQRRRHQQRHSITAGETLSPSSARFRSRSLSPHPFPVYEPSSDSSADSRSGLDEDNSRASPVYSSMSNNGSSSTRLPHQHHHYSFSDQTPDDTFCSREVLPPDYASHPPVYTA
ncbi:hypothetical protein BGW38_000841 [Lunasporangiospora selenospora]|uniref:Uncharacterized protein n=1 Tax=Lunasporangiospora selenospora TaxID=979761 RepID=A0A9P6FU97_9FUNG|nr:hypothetical protein BGW38_000841 [Lunasporangiospora selenospora]